MSGKSGTKVLNTNAKAHKLITDERVIYALAKDKSDEAKYKSHEIIDFCSKGDNYTCFVTSCKVTYTLGGVENSVTYIVKLNHCADRVSFDFMSMTAFNKEGRFYLDLIPALNSTLKAIGLSPLKTAKLFYANLEENKQSLFLQDMRVDGYKMTDRMVGLSHENVILVMKELGRLHAASQILEDNMGTEDFLKKYDFLDDFFTSDKNAECASMFKEVFTHYIHTGCEIANRVKGYEKVAKALEKLKPDAFNSLKLITEECDPKFRVINHGDCWNNNLLFKDDADGNLTDLCLVDLQINRHASLALDLNYCLMSSLTGEVRKKGVKDFLTTYYNSFKSVFDATNKQMKFSYDELVAEYRNKHTFGFLMGLLLLPIVVMASTDVPDFSDVSEENMKEKLEEFHQLNLKLIDTSPILAPRLLALFDDMVEQRVLKLE